MDYRKLAQELQSSPALNAAAESREGQRLAASLNSGELERAMRQGDTETMKKLLGQALSTPEGKALAEQVRKAVGHR